MSQKEPETPEGEDYISFMKRHVRSKSLTAYNETAPRPRPPAEDSQTINQLIPIHPEPYLTPQPPPEKPAGGPRARSQKPLRREQLKPKVDYRQMLQSQSESHNQLDVSHAEYRELIRQLDDARDGGMRRLSQMFGIEE